MALVVYDRIDAFLVGLCLYDSDQLFFHEQGIIRAVFPGLAGFDRPFRDCDFPALLGPCSLCVAELLAVRFPADFPELPVDNLSGLLFRQLRV